jgi:hypothetical protein
MALAVPLPAAVVRLVGQQPGLLMPELGLLLLQLSLLLLEQRTHPGQQGGIDISAGKFVEQVHGCAV